MLEVRNKGLGKTEPLFLTIIIAKVYKNNMYKTILYIAIFIAIFLVAKSLIQKNKQQEWTLFIYSSITPDSEKQKIKVDGYKSKNDCIEKAISLTKKNESFECASDCKPSMGNTNVCDKVCDASGCRD